MTTYVELYKITEFHLDSIFKFREDRTLPKEVSKFNTTMHLKNNYINYQKNMGKMIYHVYKRGQITIYKSWMDHD